jgi:endonuclease YncB( thermonuclease family)
VGGDHWEEAITGIDDQSHQRMSDIRFPFKYFDEFRAYEREARKNGRGLWGQSSKKQ